MAKRYTPGSNPKREAEPRKRVVVRRLDEHKRAFFVELEQLCKRYGATVAVPRNEIGQHIGDDILAIEFNTGLEQCWFDVSDGVITVLHNSKYVVPSEIKAKVT